jgi:phosphohistidine swiveling domain-containing protein
MVKNDANSKHIAQGFPVSNGIATGNAIIVKSSVDFSKIENKSGVILVAHNFDPNYDCLLPQCAGVVSEIGNLLCHLAIVSRVHKIPAVVNAKNVTSIIQDGDLITIDANKGIIYSGQPIVDQVTDEDEFDLFFGGA